MYEMTENPRQVVANAEKFMKQTEKKAKRYSAEDWQVAVQQFVAMSKNYYENVQFLSNEEQMRFDNARVKFMSAIITSGHEDVAKQVKEEYSRIFD